MLHRELVAAKLPAGWYDGEIVLLDEGGKPSFNALQNAIEGRRNDAIVFYLFDLPYCAGHDLRRVPVKQRRAVLQSVLKETQRLRFSQEIGGDAGSILQSACRLGLEGVIGKRRGSIYVQRRSDGLWPGHAPAIAFDTPQDLFAAAQLGMIELHTWNSTDRAIRQPDRMVFDLDPGDDVAWPQVQEAAMLMRALLRELGLQSWLKTTGGKGLHLFVPLLPEHGYDAVKRFSEAVVQHMARTIPQRFVARSGPRNRVGRIFIDYLRNGWVQSTAEVFSARARPGLAVSMPVRWEGLAALTGGDQRNIVTAIPHLAGLRSDPWAGYWKKPQSLTAAMERLGFTAAA